VEFRTLKKATLEGICYIVPLKARDLLPRILMRFFELK
jgi:hypothetical protein